MHCFDEVDSGTGIHSDKKHLPVTPMAQSDYKDFIQCLEEQAVVQIYESGKKH